jgi:hypothetical protein
LHSAPAFAAEVVMRRLLAAVAMGGLIACSPEGGSESSPESEEDSAPVTRQGVALADVSPRAWSGTRFFDMRPKDAAFLADGRVLVSTGGALAWFAPSGELARVLDFPAGESAEIFTMAVDRSESIGIGGYVQGVGGFLAKLDPNGNPSWRVDHLAAAEVPSDVAFAPNGDLVAAGETWLGRWDSAGQLLWISRYGGAPDGWPKAVAVALGPSGDIAIFGSGHSGTIVARFSPDGAMLWIRALGVVGPAFTPAGGIAVDARGDAYVTGMTTTSRNMDDAFVAKVDGTGEVAWIEFVSTPLVDSGQAIAALPGGGAVVVGSQGVFSGGLGSVYVARFDAEGTREWLTEMDWPGTDTADAVALSPSGEAFVGGSRQMDLYGFVRKGFLAQIDASGTVR